ncbi:MAG: hypothetical protein GF313_08895 [Caldithrix sp.]|nr:hypothetical protein [Caldithrix sp.]
MFETIFVAIIVIVAAFFVGKRIKQTLTVGEEGHKCGSCPIYQNSGNTKKS